MKIKPWIRQHPFLTYFALVFILSWGSVLLFIGGPAGIPGTAEQVKALLPLVIVAMLIGPSLSGLVMTGLTHGRAGLRELLSRLLKWQVDARWYAVALLVAPLSMAAATLVLLLVSPASVPSVSASEDKGALLLTSVVAGLAVGLFEELGWTGFAVPGLKRRYGALTTALIVGTLWGAWHLLTNLFWATNTYSGALPFSLYMALRSLLFLLGQLLAFRLLMVWAYDHTGSLLIAVLMHASLTASTFIFQPVAIIGDALLTNDVVLAAAMWIAVVVVGMATYIRRLQRPSQQPLQRQEG